MSQVLIRLSGGTFFRLLGLSVVVLSIVSCAALSPAAPRLDIEPTASRPLPLTEAPPPRLGAEMVYDSKRQVMVLFGGSANADEPYEYSNETWEYDGTTWKRIETAHAPSPRTSVLLGYDRARERVVLYGGITEGGPSFETWEYDGVDWQLQAPLAPNPTVLTGGMVYYTPQQGLLLFGTARMSSEDYETWLYHDGIWNQVSSSFPRNFGASYPALRKPGLAEDTRRRVVVMTGRSGWTYEWDGQEWDTAIEGEHDWDSSFPEAHALVFDSRRSVTVIYGVSEQSPLWEYDGIQWRSIALPAAPSLRAYPALTYDESRGVTILFGGYLIPNPDTKETTIFTDTWEYDGTTWLQR